jgi:hypothetical protein
MPTVTSGQTQTVNDTTVGGTFVEYGGVEIVENYGYVSGTLLASGAVQSLITDGEAECRRIRGDGVKPGRRGLIKAARPHFGDPLKT